MELKALLSLGLTEEAAQQVLDMAAAEERQRIQATSRDTLRSRLKDAGVTEAGTKLLLATLTQSPETPEIDATLDRWRSDYGFLFPARVSPPPGSWDGTRLADMSEDDINRNWPACKQWLKNAKEA